MRKVLGKVLPAIRPSPGEMAAELAFAELMMSHIRRNAPRGCDVVLTGSVAKRTFLRDKRDMDIFVLFNRSVPRESLEPFVKDIMAAAFPGVGYQLSYAEHPYSRFHFQGRRIDLVPAYKITKAAERVSAVDRSVLHTKFVTGMLPQGKIGEVLLLKQFLRGNGIYGAEIKVGGFSGYLCELLIIRHGGFAQLLRAASRWKPGRPVFIDIRRYYPSKKEAAGAAERFASPLVVIDPTDKNRNVAAAVTPKSAAAFISLCRRFLAKPSESFFFRKPATFEEQAAKTAKGGKLILLSMPRPDIVDDILWGQLNKMLGQLKAHMKEFGPKDILADDSRHLVRLAIVLGRDRLPERMLVEGPPLDMKKHAEQFKKSHRGARFVVKRKRLYADVKRPDALAEAAVRSFFRAFARTKSHLAFPEEMLVIEAFGTGVRRKK
jgi:tRNA nucleotidyltransferase (CCA-adding enzyme)